MSDPIKDLEEFPTMSATPLPASEVRRRGERLRRRRRVFTSIAAAAAVAVIASGGYAATQLGADDSNSQVATETPSVHEDLYGPLTKANAMTDSDTLLPSGESWPAGDVSEGNGQATTNICQQASFAGLGADQVYVGTWGIEALYLSQAVAQFPDATTAQAAADDVAQWLAECSPADTEGYTSDEPVPVGATDEVAAERVTSRWTTTGDVGGEAYADHEMNTAVLVTGNRISMITVESPTGTEGITEALDTMVVNAAVRLTTESPAPPGEDPTAQFRLPDPPASALVGEGDLPSFDLTEGYADMSGDGGTREETSPDLEGIDQILACGRTLLPQDPLPEGRLLASNSGPEFFQFRQVVGYDDADTALAQLEAMRAVIEDCPEDVARSDGLGFGSRIWQVHDAEVGPFESLTFSDTADVGLGGTLYQVTQVGRALLIVGQDGHLDAHSVPDNLGGITEDTQAVLPTVCAGFLEDGC